MPLDQQVSLLRVLQDRAITRIGGDKALLVDVRIICATNKDLLPGDRPGQLPPGSLLPPERHRHRAAAPARASGRTSPCCSILSTADRPAAGAGAGRSAPEVIARLQAYDWPGNLREFQNVLERMVNACGRRPITLDDLPDEILGGPASRNTDPRVPDLRRAREAEPPFPAGAPGRHQGLPGGPGAPGHPRPHRPARRQREPGCPFSGLLPHVPVPQAGPELRPVPGQVSPCASGVRRPFPPRRRRPPAPRRWPRGCAPGRRSAAHEVHQLAVPEDGHLGRTGGSALEVLPGPLGGLGLHAGEHRDQVVEAQSPAAQRLDHARAGPRRRRSRRPS